MSWSGCPTTPLTLSASSPPKPGSSRETPPRPPKCSPSGGTEPPRRTPTKISPTRQDGVHRTLTVNVPTPWGNVPTPWGNVPEAGGDIPLLGGSCPNSVLVAGGGHGA